VLRQKFRAELAIGLRDAFGLMLQALAEQRWANAQEPGLAVTPRVDLRYTWRRGNRLRSGRIVECLRPVALTLSEVLLDPPSHVQLRLRYRLEPSNRGAILQHEAGYALNGAAALRKRYWTAEVQRYWEALLRVLELTARDQVSQDYTLCKGQNTGSSSITIVNTTSVRGTPSFK
jgi:hypothetical protein